MNSIRSIRYKHHLRYLLDHEKIWSSQYKHLVDAPFPGQKLLIDCHQLPATDHVSLSSPRFTADSRSSPNYRIPPIVVGKICSMGFSDGMLIFNALCDFCFLRVSPKRALPIAEESPARWLVNEEAALSPSFWVSLDYDKASIIVKKWGQPLKSKQLHSLPEESGLVII